MQQLIRLLIFFNSALHVSGDKFAHPQEHFFDCIYSFLVQCTDTAAGGQQCRCTVPKAVYTVKCSLGLANLSPEARRAELKKINKRISCCILLVAYIYFFQHLCIVPYIQKYFSKW